MTQIINIIAIIVWLLIALLSLGLLDKAKREYEGYTRYMREFIMRQKEYKKKDAKEKPFHDYPRMETEFSYDEASNISVCLNCGFTIGGKVKGINYCPRCGCRLKKAHNQTKEED